MDDDQFEKSIVGVDNITKKYRGDDMSMRGQLITKEYNRMVFVNDKNGKQYVCYTSDIKNHKDGENLTENERAKCMDVSLVLGDSW